MALPPASRHVPALMDELLEEIFIRLPLDDPAILFCIALVCKPWHRVVSGASLHRRLFELYGSPPLRGFFCRVGGRPAPRFIPVSSSSSLRRLSAGDAIPHWRPVGSLHGCVLIKEEDAAGLLDGCINLAVWNPIGGEMRRLPRAPLQTFRWNAALLYAAPGQDHLDYGYGSGVFKVALVGTRPSDGVTSAYIYSSEQRAWSKPVSAEFNGVQVKVGSSASAIAGSSLYVLCDMTRKILEYDFGKQELSLIRPPISNELVWEDWHHVALVRVEGGSLGFAMTQKSKVFMWSRQAGGVDNGDAGWVQQRVIQLNRMIPARNNLFPFSTPYVSAVAEQVSVIFIHTCDGLFSIDLKSGQVTQLIVSSYIIRDVVPYVSFCTPAFGNRAAFAGDQDATPGALSAGNRI